MNRLQKFCADKSIRLVWEIFNTQFEERFTAWMISKNYTANTIAAQYSIMKVWLAEAEIQGDHGLKTRLAGGAELAGAAIYRRGAEQGLGHRYHLYRYR